MSKGGGRPNRPTKRKRPVLGPSAQPIHTTKATFSGREIAVLLVATALAIGSLKGEDPLIVLPMLGISCGAFIYLCITHKGRVSYRIMTAVGITLVLVLIASRLFIWPKTLSERRVTIAFLMYPLPKTLKPVNNISTVLVNGVAEVSFTAMVEGSVMARKGSLWIKIGEGCEYASEPEMQCPTCGPFLKASDEPQIRSRGFDMLYPNVTLPRTVLRVAPPHGARWFEIGFWYACENCDELNPGNPQKVRVNLY